LVNGQTTKLLNHNINEGQYHVPEKQNYEKKYETQKPMYDKFVNSFDVE